METASPGPRRIRINPFSSSSSIFSSRAEGRAGWGAGIFSGSEGRLDAPMGVDSLKRSCEAGGRDQYPPAGLAQNPYPLARVEGYAKPGSPKWSVLESQDVHRTVPVHAPRLTRRVSNSFLAWLSCFSSSAILAMDSFSASRSRSVSCGTGTW